MKNKINQKGQTVVALLFFMVISVTVMTSIIIIVANNILSATSMEQGTQAYYAAETGVENALLRLLRNPSYNGETINLNDGTVTVEVNSGIITSTANIANSIRKIQVETVYNNNVLTVLSWREIN